MISVKIKLLNNSCFLSRGSEEAACWDARANIPEPVILEAGDRMLIPLGVIIELEKGTECQVRPRSGLALKKGITILNTPGTVDSDYRAEVCAIVYNASRESFAIEPHDRIAQLFFGRVEETNIIEVDSTNGTSRGEGGFGSSGIRG